MHIDSSYLALDGLSMGGSKTSECPVNGRLNIMPSPLEPPTGLLREGRSRVDGYERCWNTEGCHCRPVNEEVQNGGRLLLWFRRRHMEEYSLSETLKSERRQSGGI